MACANIMIKQASIIVYMCGDVISTTAGGIICEVVTSVVWVNSEKPNYYFVVFFPKFLNDDL